MQADLQLCNLQLTKHDITFMIETPFHVYYREVGKKISTNCVHSGTSLLGKFSISYLCSRLFGTVKPVLSYHPFR